VGGKGFLGFSGFLGVWWLVIGVHLRYPVYWNQDFSGISRLRDGRFCFLPALDPHFVPIEKSILTRARPRRGGRFLRHGFLGCDIGTAPLKQGNVQSHLMVYKRSLGGPPATGLISTSIIVDNEFVGPVAHAVSEQGRGCR